MLLADGIRELPDITVKLVPLSEYATRTSYPELHPTLTNLCKVGEYVIPLPFISAEAVAALQFNPSAEYAIGRELHPDRFTTTLFSSFPTVIPRNPERYGFVGSFNELLPDTHTIPSEDV
jgi:hypothetical protein